jgi:hypothetical protein
MAIDSLHIEPIRKRRRGFASQTQVKCGVRVVHGDVECPPE